MTLFFLYPPGRHAVEKVSFTHISLVATQAINLMESSVLLKALQKSKCILLGGSAISGKLLSRGRDLSLPFYTSYGSSEMSSQVYTKNPLGNKQNTNSKSLVNDKEKKEVKEEPDNKEVQQGQEELKDKKSSEEVADADKEDTLASDSDSDALDLTD